MLNIDKSVSNARVTTPKTSEPITGAGATGLAFRGVFKPERLMSDTQPSAATNGPLDETLGKDLPGSHSHPHTERVESTDERTSNNLNVAFLIDAQNPLMFAFSNSVDVTAPQVAEERSKWLEKESGDLAYGSLSDGDDSAGSQVVSLRPFAESQHDFLESIAHDKALGQNRLGSAADLKNGSMTMSFLRHSPGLSEVKNNDTNGLIIEQHNKGLEQSVLEKNTTERGKWHSFEATGVISSFKGMRDQANWGLLPFNGTTDPKRQSEIMAVKFDLESSSLEEKVHSNRLATMAANSVTSLLSEPTLKTPMVSTFVAAKPGEAQLSFDAVTVSSLSGQSTHQTSAPILKDPVLVTTPLLMHGAQWQGDLVSRLMLLQAKGVERAEIQLDPQELGPLQIKLVRSQQEVSISVQATHSQTRDLLEMNQERLREQLMQQGLQLSQFDVKQQGSETTSEPSIEMSSTEIEDDENDSTHHLIGTTITMSTQGLDIFV